MNTTLMNASTHLHSLDASAYLARCDELSRLLQRLLVGLDVDELRVADQRRLARIQRRLSSVAAQR